MDITTYACNGRDYVWAIDGLQVADVVRADDVRPILDNLREFQPADRLPKGMRRMKQGRCFNNALHTWARYDLRYAEGFTKVGRHWIRHAWNLDADDRVIDRTLTDGERYVGAVIDAKDLLEWTKDWGRAALGGSDKRWLPFNSRKPKRRRSATSSSSARTTQTRKR